MYQVKHSGCDGSHRGLADWYSDLEENIIKALAKGPAFEWTTNWYASKHEIATANITCKDGDLLIEASVSDDFDTPGYGSGVIPHTEDLDMIRKKIYEVWDEALEDKRENEMFIGYSVIHAGSWVETYLRPRGDGWYLDEPPGDSYYEWGWQGETDLEDDVKEALSAWVESQEDGEFEYKNYKIEPWKEE